MKIIKNLTRNTYIIKDELGEEIGRIPPLNSTNTKYPFVKYNRVKLGDETRIPFYDTKVVGIRNLPHQDPDVIYIVPPPVRRVCKDKYNRVDCVTPIKAKAMDENLVECRGFTY